MHSVFKYILALGSAFIVGSGTGADKAQAAGTGSNGVDDSGLQQSLVNRLSDEMTESSEPLVTRLMAANQGLLLNRVPDLAQQTVDMIAALNQDEVGLIKQFGKDLAELGLDLEAAVAIEDAIVDAIDDLEDLGRITQAQADGLVETVLVAGIVPQGPVDVLFGTEEGAELALTSADKKLPFAELAQNAGNLEQQILDAAGVNSLSDVPNLAQFLKSFLDGLTSVTTGQLNVLSNALEAEGLDDDISEVVEQTFNDALDDIVDRGLVSQNQANSAKADVDGDGQVEGS